MLDKLTQIAPLGTWALVLGAAFLLLCGFVAYGHAKVAREAYGKEFRGPLAPGLYETMLRWTVVLLAWGTALWGMALDWSSLVLAALFGLVGVVLLGETVARLRG